MPTKSKTDNAQCQQSMVSRELLDAVTHDEMEEDPEPDGEVFVDICRASLPCNARVRSKVHVSMDFTIVCSRTSGWLQWLGWRPGMACCWLTMQSYAVRRVPCRRGMRAKSEACRR
ncbi:hypothetical protein IG631_06001 [Alternaria alternata]|nr:hypothetical protein IG631_06001 [Alternaria alternata]